MKFVPLVFILPFLGLAILFSRGKGAELIAGYNTASRARREQTDEKALCRFMSRVMLACFFSALMIWAGTAWGPQWLSWLGIGLILLSAVGGASYAGAGGRFQKRK